jgi:hypothetical protein
MSANPKVAGVNKTVSGRPKRRSARSPKLGQEFDLGSIALNAALSWFLVEKPAISLKSRLEWRSTAPAGSVSLGGRFRG